ncbi:MAG: hypothetical protein K9H64_03590 [Bacteroidales bacterium]|nr:hypothetical protein [Bacteroidales bacterium]MCF8457398.1 hypothetical protein [Bacteroidales bacterium]
MNLEKIILENIETFDSSEPKEGHFDRFDRKLENKFNRKEKRAFTFYLKIAAVMALGLMSTLWLYEKFSADPLQQSSSSMALSDISPEYAEVEMYYTSTINNSLNDLDPFFKENEELKDELLTSEFGQLDSLYQDLQKELANDPNDEQIIDAMILHYQTKLEIISTILNQLKKVKTQKPKNHENNEI